MNFQRGRNTQGEENMRLYDEKCNRWVRHRDTTEYKLRKRKLRDYWTIGLLSILPFTPGIQIAVLLLGVFVSFSYLDETPYKSV